MNKGSPSHIHFCLQVHQTEGHEEEDEGVEEETIPGRASALRNLKDRRGRSEERTQDGHQEGVHHRVGDGVADDVEQQRAEQGDLSTLHELRTEHFGVYSLPRRKTVSCLKDCFDPAGNTFKIGLHLRRSSIRRTKEIQGIAFTDKADCADQEREALLGTSGLPPKVVHPVEGIHKGTKGSDVRRRVDGSPHCCPEHPNRVLCILVRDVLIRPRREVHCLLGLFLLMRAVLENPRHPIQDADGVPHICLQMIAHLIHGNRQLIGVSLLDDTRRRVLCGGTHHLPDCLRCEIVLRFDPRHRHCFVLPTQGKNACRSTDEIPRILAVSNVCHCLQGKLVFNCRELLIGIRNIEDGIGAHPMDLLCRHIKERCPQRMDQTRAQEFQRPEARIICMSQSNGLGKRFQDVGTRMP